MKVVPALAAPLLSCSAHSDPTARADAEDEGDAGDDFADKALIGGWPRRVGGRGCSRRPLPSPVVWYRLRSAPERKFERPALVFGDAVYNYNHAVAVPRRETNSRGLPNLPNTRKEALFLQDLFYGGGANGAEHVFLDMRANRDRLLKLSSSGRLRDYRVLHFALHGRYVVDDPEENALLFSLPEVLRNHAGEKYERYVKTHGKPGPFHDLRLGEIKSLDLRAELVTLSACETSLGENVTGEGMIGLPHAFLLSGARRVLGSLWEVDDRAAVEFMREFYTSLHQVGLDPARALGAARRKLAQMYEDPYFWGSFVLFSG